MEIFCPFCGKSNADGKFIGEICEECVAKRLKPLPLVKIKVCKNCEKILDRGGDRKKTTAAEEIARTLKLRKLEPVISKDLSSVEYDSKLGRITQALEVKFEKPLCSQCSRANSQYFEAIIQLRGEARKVERTAERIVKRLEEKSFVPKIEELKEGLDIYCGSRQEAISALNRHSLPYMRTEKLAGLREGKRVYRTTLLVRL